MISHRSGYARVAQLLSALTPTEPMIGPTSVPRPPTAHPDDRLERLFRRHLARVDDSHLRRVERASQAGDDRGVNENEQLEV